MHPQRQRRDLNLRHSCFRVIFVDKYLMPILSKVQMLLEREGESGGLNTICHNNQRLLPLNLLLIKILSRLLAREKILVSGASRYIQGLNICISLACQLLPDR